MNMDEKTVAEREAVLRERAAFIAGVKAILDAQGDHAIGRWRGSDVIAAERYPLPKVTRPRVIEVPMHQYGSAMIESRKYRLFNKVFQVWSPRDCCWLPTLDQPTPERAIAWLDLFNTPNEEVDA